MSNICIPYAGSPLSGSAFFAGISPFPILFVPAFEKHLKTVAKILVLRG